MLESELARIRLHWICELPWQNGREGHQWGLATPNGSWHPHRNCHTQGMLKSYNRVLYDVSGYHQLAQSQPVRHESPRSMFHSWPICPKLSNELYTSFFLILVLRVSKPCRFQWWDLLAASSNHITTSMTSLESARHYVASFLITASMRQHQQTHKVLILLVWHDTM